MTALSHRPPNLPLGSQDMHWGFILMFGLAFTIVGAVWGLARWKLRRRGVRTTGTVIDIAIRIGIPKVFTPVVEFRTDAGQKIRFRGSTGMDASPAYQQGQVVKVIYSRQDPRDAQIDNFEQFWLGPVSIGSFGLIVLGVLWFT